MHCDAIFFEILKSCYSLSVSKFDVSQCVRVDIVVLISLQAVKGFLRIIYILFYSTFILPGGPIENKFLFTTATWPR